MMMNVTKAPLLSILILLGSFLTSFGQRTHNALVLFEDTTTSQYGYKDANGKIVIPAGKYQMCFTDTFRTYAIVFMTEKGIVAIDRQENILYRVYIFDNGPDYSSDGLFRIRVKDKIGYADSATGAIVITPQFTCAYPFEHGKAQVSVDCKTIQSDEEHSTWTSNSWYYIDKKGKKVRSPKSTPPKKL